MNFIQKKSSPAVQQNSKEANLPSVAAIWNSIFLLCLYIKNKSQNFIWRKVFDVRKTYATQIQLAQRDGKKLAKHF